jgi:L-arabinose isomerase
VQHEVGSTPVAESGSYGGPCCVTEAYNALERCGIEPKDFIFGRQSGKWYAAAFEKEVNEWCRVADAVRSYKGAIFGHLGHSCEGMLDMNFDPTTFTCSFGIHVKMLEMCELIEYVKGTTEAEIKAKLDEMNETLVYLDPSYDSTTVPTNQEDIDWAAQCAIGLDKLVESNHLSAMAYYYEGLNNYYERVASNLIIGNSLLVSKGISLAGDPDMKTCMAMYTTSAIGAGGSFAEYGIALADNIMLVGHDRRRGRCARGAICPQGSRGYGAAPVAARGVQERQEARCRHD